MFFMVCGLGVLSETFRKPLGNRSSRVDVFRLGKESGCPDSVAFFEQFVQEVSFQVRSRLGSRLGFVFLISIFYEGWEGATSTGIYSIDGMAVSAVASHFSAVSAIISGWPAYSEAKYRTARTNFSSSWPFSHSATSMYLIIKQYTKPQVHILQHNKLSGR